jgi:hypothetical protein
MGGSLTIRLRAEIKEPIVDPVFGVLVHDSLGTPLLDLRTIHSSVKLGRIQGPVNLQLRIDNVGLYPGHYFLSPWITDSACKRNVDFPRLCAAFDVQPMDTAVDLQLDADWGRYFVPSSWTVL